jgi:hypothetical protein
MENLLDLVNEGETQRVETDQSTATPETVENEASEVSAAPQTIEEIDTAPKLR